LVGVLVVANLNHVSVINNHDPRNYESAAKSDFASEAYDVLQRRMDRFSSLRGAERRTHLWQARAALAEGRVKRAGAEFAIALLPIPPDERLILPPPTSDEREDFLVRLRDATSALPAGDRGLAYPRALLAAGDPASALGSLRHRVAYFPREGLDVPAQPLAQATAFLLGQLSFSDALGEFAPAQLALLLGECGATVAQAPSTVPREHLPIVLAAYADARGVHVFAWVGGEAVSTTGGWDDGALWTTCEWSVSENGAVLVAEGSRTLAEVSFTPTLAAGASSAGSYSAATPDSPALLLWIP
jgi:hypothetical protein